MMNNENKILTAGVLREKLGDYPVIQELTKGKADDYVFNSLNLLDRNDCVACKLWCREDIADKLKELGYKGTNEQVKDVLNEKDIIECLEDATDADWDLIESGCKEAGYEDLMHKVWPWIWKNEDYFKAFCKAVKNGTADENWCHDEAEYICSLSCGSICFDLMCTKDSNRKIVLRLDLYVGGIDTDYGYINGYPYTDVPEIEKSFALDDLLKGSTTLKYYTNHLKESVETMAKSILNQEYLCEINGETYSLLEKIQEPMEW